MMIWILIDAAICAAVGAIITSARGAGVIVGVLLGAVFGPLGVIASFAFGGAAKSTNGTALAQMRTCPICAEEVRAAAVKCRFCNTELEPIAAQAIISEGETIDEKSKDNDFTAIVFLILAIIAVFVTLMLAVA